jgi:hypothetical protein
MKVGNFPKLEENSMKKLSFLFVLSLLIVIGCDDSSSSNNTTSFCGDNRCDASENVLNCHTDCDDECGDGICHGTEDSTSCSQDCTVDCGNGTCDGSETPLTCPVDCKGSCGDNYCITPETSITCYEDCGTNCGDGVCNGDEDSTNCSQDCAEGCGDGTCIAPETYATCPADCAPECGNSIVEGDEDCDASDLNNEDCENLGYDGGTLSCSGSCMIDESECVNCATGLSFCDDACVDVLTDNENCSECASSCGVNNICVGGKCETIDQPWTTIGSPADNVIAHHMASDGLSQVVAYITAGATGEVNVISYSGTPLQWNNMDPSPSLGASPLNAAVSLEFSGATPYIMFSVQNAPATLHIMARDNGSWQEVGAPGYNSACWMHSFIDFAMNGVEPHITTYGAGGCGVGIDYAWWDGGAWQTEDSTTGFPGQITMNGQGDPGIIFTDKAYIGVPESGHGVRYWNENTTKWDILGELLDENVVAGWEEPMSLISDSQGNIYVAWSENNAAGLADIYVKKYSVEDQTWTLVGIGTASGTGMANYPSIALIGSELWISFVEREGAAGIDQVYVRKFDKLSSSWIQVGELANEDPAENAYYPVITGVAGVPYIAFREDSTSGQLLYIKSYE